VKIKKKKPTQLSTLSHTHDTAPQRDLAISNFFLMFTPIGTVDKKNQPSSQFAPTVAVVQSTHPPHFLLLYRPSLCTTHSFAICHFQSPNKWGSRARRARCICGCSEVGPPLSSPPSLPPDISFSWSRRSKFGAMRAFETESSAAC
jgi:hypothetical protein